MNNQEIINLFESFFVMSFKIHELQLKQKELSERLIVLSKSNNLPEINHKDLLMAKITNQIEDLLKFIKE